MFYRQETRIVLIICLIVVHILFLLLTIGFHFLKEWFSSLSNWIFDFLRTYLIIAWERLYFFKSCLWEILSLWSKSFSNDSILLDVNIFAILPVSCWVKTRKYFQNASLYRKLSAGLLVSTICIKWKFLFCSERL